MLSTGIGLTTYPDKCLLTRPHVHSKTLYYYLVFSCHPNSNDIRVDRRMTNHKNPLINQP